MGARSRWPLSLATKALTRLLRLRTDLVVIDDIGLLPVGPDAAEGLYRLVDAAYEKRSVGISSNLHPAAFDEHMPKTLATDTVDRLLHHARLPDQRRQRPTVPSPRRTGGEAADLTTSPRWPPEADPVAISGHIS